VTIATRYPPSNSRRRVIPVWSCRLPLKKTSTSRALWFPVGLIARFRHELARRGMRDSALTMHTPAEQLGRMARELGEALATALGDKASQYENVVVEVVRENVGDLPKLTLTVGPESAMHPLTPRASIRECVPKLVALGGKYKEWLHVAIRFHGSQLPIPVEVSVRPVSHEPHHHG
jgi:hypothetical protein